jgi:hypothetical protein
MPYIRAQIHIYATKQIKRIMSSGESPTAQEVKCDLCGLSFATAQEKEEHMKLEHKEHQRPTGVG